MTRRRHLPLAAAAPRRLALPVLALLLAAACASTTPSASPPSRSRARDALDLPGVPAVEIPHLEERALLLGLVDQRVYEPFTVLRLLDGDAELRRDLAVGLGRIGESRCRGPLQGLLVDADAGVRRAAAFALGELGQAEAKDALLRAATAGDRDTGVAAVEALAKLEVPLAEVVEPLLKLPEKELWARLLPSLFRFAAGRQRMELAQLALERVGTDPLLHGRAAFALARDAQQEAAPALRGLLADGDPWLRGWAARGLGQVGSGEDLAVLRPLLDDPQPGPVMEALRAAARLIEAGKAAAPPAWRARLLELAADGRPGVRMTAIEAAAAWLPDDDVASALRALAADGQGRARELALLALARGGDGQASTLVRAALAGSDQRLRARAAEAAARLPDGQLLDRLLLDSDPVVRAAAVGARLEKEEGGKLVANNALRDADAAVRAQALAWLTEHPELPFEEITRAMAGPDSGRIVEVWQDGIRALVARAKAEPLERGGIVQVLEQLGESVDFLIRRAVARGLVELGQPAPPVGSLNQSRSLEVYRQILQQTAAPRFAEIVTARGTLRLRLECPQAPQTCLNFLQLAAHGFFDGLTFHRVVPDFVVQGGDPRGDGWGGPGYSLRDEINELRFERGAVGMALSGPDTGGSQFFITLSPQPHLDGGYTVFGRVVGGEEALDLIEQGDRIERVREVS